MQIISRKSVLVTLLGAVFFFALSNNALSDEEGLVGYWPMDEGDGRTVYDCSGKGDDGTVLGDAVWENTGKGAALKFNGVDTTVKLPENSNYNIR